MHGNLRPRLKGLIYLSWELSDIFDWSHFFGDMSVFELSQLTTPLELAEAMMKGAEKIKLLTEKEDDTTELR